MGKYRIPVYIETTASKYIGEVECDSLEEFVDKSHELWKSQDYEYPSLNITNNFDLGDFDLYDVKEADLKYYSNTTNNKGAED